MSAPVPPSWKDLGKAGNDLLSKDYPTQGTSLEVKTRAQNGVVFKVAGSKDKSGSIAGDIETKYVNPKQGLTLTETWTTKNQLKTQIEAENHLAKGLKFEGVATLEPETAAKSATLTAHYKQPGLHARGLFNVFKGPMFNPDIVVGRDGFFAGAEAQYDVRDGQIKGYNTALGFAGPDYIITVHALQKLSTFSASYYHRVNSEIDVAAKAIYSSKAPTSNVALEVGCKSYLDVSSFIKAKINNSGILCLGYTQALRPGVKAAFGLSLDTQKMGFATGTPGTTPASGPAHSVGASLTFEA